MSTLSIQREEREAKAQAAKKKPKKKAAAKKIDTADLDTPSL